MSLREWQEIQEVLRRLTQAVLSFCASVEARGAPTPREFMAADYDYISGTFGATWSLRPMPAPVRADRFVAPRAHRS